MRIKPLFKECQPKQSKQNFEMIKTIEARNIAYRIIMQSRFNLLAFAIRREIGFLDIVMRK